MLTLAAPDPDRYADWKAAFDEFGANPKDGTGFRADDVVDTSLEGFAAYLEDRARQADTRIPPREGFVHCTFFWVLDDGELVGFLALRHELNDLLHTCIGHIGYSVRPSVRGRGVATGALRLGLDEARERGIEQVLLTCSVTNDASRAVIEKCGGVFEDIREHSDFPGKVRRYWFGTPPWPVGPAASTTAKLAEPSTSASAN